MKLNAADGMNYAPVGEKKAVVKQEVKPKTKKAEKTVQQPPVAEPTPI